MEFLNVWTLELKSDNTYTQFDLLQREFYVNSELVELAYILDQLQLA